MYAVRLYGIYWGDLLSCLLPTHSNTLSSLSTLQKIIISLWGVVLHAPLPRDASAHKDTAAMAVPGAGAAERKGLWVWIYVSVPSACEVRKHRAESQSHTHAHLRKASSPQPIVLGHNSVRVRHMGMLSHLLNSQPPTNTKKMQIRFVWCIFKLCRSRSKCRSVILFVCESIRKHYVKIQLNSHSKNCFDKHYKRTTPTATRRIFGTLHIH